MFKDLLRVILLVAVWPITFFGIVWGWVAVDRFYAHYETIDFIERHHAIVEQRLKDPRVYSFSISHDPRTPSRLLICFDVEDKETYELLESDLKQIWQMRSLPRWETSVRSKERLGNDLGYMAAGMGVVGELYWRLFVAVLCATVAELIAYWLLFRPAKKQTLTIPNSTAGF